MVKYLFLMAFTTLAVAVDGASSDPCSKLSKAGAFSLGYEVAAGTMISENRAFAQILRRSDHLSCFAKVIGMGTNEAQMYALVALRELSPTQYAAAVNRVRARRPFTVTTIATKEQGVLRREPSKTVIARIESGEYRSEVEFWLKHDVPPEGAWKEMAPKQLQRLKARLRQASQRSR